VETIISHFPGGQIITLHHHHHHQQQQQQQVIIALFSATPFHHTRYASAPVLIVYHPRSLL
jgi:hypothetical protein